MLENLIAFLGSSFIITLAPGPDIIFSITQGITHGKKAGLITAFGLALGNVIHTIFAILGIALVFKTNEYAFIGLKIVGVLYLVFLGYQSYINRDKSIELKNSEVSSKNLFVKGFIMNVINPKVAIFFIAFFPQFIDPKLGDIKYQMLALGICFILIVILVFGSLSYYAGFIGELLKHNTKITKYINVSASIIFFALSIKLLLLKI